MRKSRLVLGCVLGTLALGPVGSALSQAGSVSERVAEAEWDGLLNVTFAGGTLTEFVRAVQAAAEPMPVNVVLREQAGKVEVPAVTLRRVTVEAAFEAMCPDELIELRVVHGGGDPIIVIEERSQPSHSMSPASIRGLEMSAARREQEQRLALRVYPVRELVEGGTVTYATVLDVLRVALEAEGSEPKAEIMHHEPSGVLIVRGTAQHEMVTRLVLDAIRTDLIGARESRESLTNQRAGAEQSVLIAEVQVRRTEINENAATKRLQMAQAMKEEGYATDEEMLKAELGLEHARLERLEAEGMLRGAQMRLERIRSRSDAASGPSTMTESEIQIETLRPEIVKSLLTALNLLLEATGERGRISVVDAARTNDAGRRLIKVQFRGDAGATKVFPELMKHVCELDQSGQ